MCDFDRLNLFFLGERVHVILRERKQPQTIPRKQVSSVISAP